MKKANFFLEGTILLYSNGFSDFNNKEIRNCFEKITKQQVLELKLGSIIWEEVEPNMHGGGKVYGFTATGFAGNKDTEYYQIKDGSYDKLITLVAITPKSQLFIVTNSKYTNTIEGPFN